MHSSRSDHECREIPSQFSGENGNVRKRYTLKNATLELLQYDRSHGNTWSFPYQLLMEGSTGVNIEIPGNSSEPLSVKGKRRVTGQLVYNPESLFLPVVGVY